MKVPSSSVLQVSTILSNAGSMLDQRRRHWPTSIQQWAVNQSNIVLAYFI